MKHIIESVEFYNNGSYWVTCMYRGKYTRGISTDSVAKDRVLNKDLNPLQKGHYGITYKQAERILRQDAIRYYLKHK